MARRPKSVKETKADATEELDEQDASEEISNEVEDAAEDAPSIDAQHSQCGGVLAAARTKQGLSIKDIAKQLRLSNTQIDALEQDDYARLPEATIVKGFIRNYAKLLKIPAEPLLNAYVDMVPAKDDYSFALNPGINMKITEGRQSHKLRYFFIVAALLLGAGVWFFYQNYVQKPNPITPMPEVVEALPELALPMSEREQGTSATQLEMPEQKQVVTGEADTQAAVDKGEVASEKIAEVEATVKEETTLIAEKTLASQEAVKLETVVPEPAEVEAVTNNPPPVLGKTRLAFAATQETWVSVVNTSGKEVFSKILYAGNHEVVDVRSPSEIVVGNAHGATLSIDGQSIDLAPYTRINVARVRMNRIR